MNANNNASNNRNMNGGANGVNPAMKNNIPRTNDLSKR